MAVRDDNALALPLQILGVLRRRPFAVLLPAVLAMGVTMVMLGTRLPTWSASAVLVMREPVRLPTDLTRKDLPSTAAELAHLSSLATTREVVSSARSDDGADDDAGAAKRHLSLGVIVDDLSYRPLHGFLPGTTRPEGYGRLHARLLERTPDAPGRIEVSFPARDRVHLGPVGEDERPEAEVVLAGGAPVSYAGLTFELDVVGDVVGRVFHLRFLGEESAAFDVLSRLSVGETRKGSRVIEVYFEDTDPQRAAEVVNAVCENHLALSRERQKERSARRLERVDEEIERMRAELVKAFDELTKLRNERPLSVDPEQSAKFLSLNLAELDLEIADVQLERASVAGTIERLRAGDLGGLSQLARSTADETTRTLIEQFVQLRGQLFVQDRSDAGSYRRLLQERIAQLSELKSDLEQEIAGQESALAGLRKDGLVGLGSLGGLGRGATGVDAVTHVLIERAATLQAEFDEKSEELQPRHPDLARLSASITEHEEKLESLLVHRVEGLKRQLAHQEEFLAETRRMHELHPEHERAEIERALERMQPPMLGHLENLEAALRRQEVSTMTEILQLRRELALLPESERIQLDSTQRVRHYRERTAELLETKEALALEVALGEPTLDLVDPAAPASLPSAPRFRFGIALAAFLGLFVGVLIALAAETASDRIATPEDAERTAGVEVLGVVGDLPVELEPLPEAFRSLRANLAFGLPNDGHAALGLTSSERGRTRGSTALGLAQAMSVAGKSVLLVLVEPAGEEGALPLVGGGDWAQGWLSSVRPSQLENVHLLGPGVVGSATYDPFADHKTLQVVSRMREEYDVVLFDLPAVRESADAESLSPHLDGLLVSVPRELARHRPLEESVRRLRRCGGNVLGLVWNEGKRPLDVVSALPGGVTPASPVRRAA